MKLILIPEGITLETQVKVEYGPTQDIAMAISLWRTEILRRVAPLVRDRQHLVLFAWRHDLTGEIAESEKE